LTQADDGGRSSAIRLPARNPERLAVTLPAMEQRTTPQAVDVAGSVPARLCLSAALASAALAALWGFAMAAARHLEAPPESLFALPPKTLVAAPLLGLLLVAERLLPERRPCRPRTPTAWRNLALGAVNGLVVTSVLGGATLLVTTHVRAAGWGLLSALPLPPWAQTALALLLLDLWMYVFHRLRLGAVVVGSGGRHADLAQAAGADPLRRRRLGGATPPDPRGDAANALRQIDASRQNAISRAVSCRPRLRLRARVLRSAASASTASRTRPSA
jgi:hypothetical protein